MPDPNYETLKYLITHLLKIVDMSSVNLMGAKNLAVVFGPNLMKSPAEKTASENGEVNAVAELGDMALKNTVVEYMISNGSDLFKASDMKRQDPEADISSFIKG